MSMLSSTQGTSERVWSLIALLREHDGKISRADAAAWLNPEFLKDGQTIGEKSGTFGQVLGAATSMGAVTLVGPELQLNPTCEPDTYDQLADWLYHHLIELPSQDKDAVFLELFAWLVCESAKRQTAGWPLGMTNPEFADNAEAALPSGAEGDVESRMNSTKVPFVRRWLVFLGLMEDLNANPSFEIDMSRRFRREVTRLGLDREVPIEAEEFLRIMRQKMPFIDGGRMYMDAARRINFTPDPRQLSPVLSEALRDLHDEGMLELNVLGDLSSNLRLHPNATHKVSAFYAVTIKGGA
ncbi:hypothetical protein DEM27_24120 [Metarhizobium album]|uniref:Uncharacterized protein n=1 Tax=Metarhizobium album TaxID=2182425 RepID=A0A2U2DJZ8_9HYPH|nr:hypothetical protein [Rhizobium album]PWE53639.1 hypothetical protein DEM27_24120 [Rhizobium album]